MENILEKIPKENQKELRPKLSRIFYGTLSLEQARDFVETFKKDYGKRFPEALSTLLNDIDQCLRFYLFPHDPSEEACLSLLFQATRRYAADQKVNSFSVTELTMKQWEKLRANKATMMSNLIDLFSQAAYENPIPAEIPSTNFHQKKDAAPRVGSPSFKS